MTLTELLALWDERTHRYGHRYLTREMVAAIDAHRLAEIRELPGSERQRAWNEHKGRMLWLEGRVR